MPDNIRLRHFRLVLFVKRTGDTAQQGALLVGIEVSNGGILGEFCAIPLI